MKVGDRVIIQSANPTFMRQWRERADSGVGTPLDSSEYDEIILAQELYDVRIHNRMPEPEMELDEIHAAQELMK